MRSFKTIWDVTPETCHPRARQLLNNSIIWDYGNEDSPLGTDVGADTFAAYIGFRGNHSADGVDHFLREQLGLRGLSDKAWNTVKDAELKILIERSEGAQLVRRDDLIIALAFAQLLLEGEIAPSVRSRAIDALHRQATPTVLSFRGGGGEDPRRGQLHEFRRILEAA